MAGRIILGIANPSLDSNGEPAASSTLTFYTNLTTTLVSIFDGPDLLTPLANPLTCDAAGRFPEVWAADGYYSVKWSVPGETPITYDDIDTFFTSGDDIVTDDISPATAGAGVGIMGVTDGSSADAGDVGEYVESNVLSTSAVNLITNTPADVTAISLTAGDYDVWGEVIIGVTVATPTGIAAWTSFASATAPGISDARVINNQNHNFVVGNYALPLAPRRVKVTSTTTVYLSAMTTAGTTQAWGFLAARRVR